MLAIDFVNKMSIALLALVGVGGAFMGLIQGLRLIMAKDESDAARAKKNLDTIVKGVIIGLSVTGLIKAIFSII